MPQHVGFIVTLATSLTMALIFGLITNRLKLSPILGYLVAGVVIGRFAPVWVADFDVASQLAEVGVILLMFGVGLHFKLGDIWAVRGIAVPGAIGQTLIVTALGALLAVISGWSMASGLVLGLAISIASTVVLIRVLTDHKRLDTPDGRIALGLLVVEDVLTVLVLVMLPALVEVFRGQNTGAKDVVTSLSVAVIKIAGLAIVVLAGGRRLIPWVLGRAANTGSQELFTLTILVIALGIATGSALLFGVSMALGAFLAGMVVGQSELSHQAGAEALPLRDAFAVLFFVSVGMLFDPGFLLEEPLLVAGTLAIILIGKPVITLLIVIGLGYSVRTALTVGVSRAQIGEFSFVLGQLGSSLEVLPPQGRSVLIAAAILSIALNPLYFRFLEPLEEALRRRPALWNMLTRRALEYTQMITQKAAEKLVERDLKSHAVVVGFGPVGQTLHRMLREFGLDPVVIDLNIDTVHRLAGDGISAIYGDATRSEILKAAGIQKAQYLLVTVPDYASRFPIIITARSLNPALRIFVRAHYAGEYAMLNEVGATEACYEEVEAAAALAELLLRDIGAEEERIEREIGKVRWELALRRTEFGTPPARGAPA